MSLFCLTIASHIGSLYKVDKMAYSDSFANGGRCRNHLILHIPHSGTKFKYNKWDNQNKLIEAVYKMTDWHTDKLFRPVKDISPAYYSMFIFDYNRFDIDVERLLIDEPMEKLGQGIAYSRFDEFGITRLLSEKDLQEIRREKINWDSKVGQAISSIPGNKGVYLIDCHSFPRVVSDIDFNIGFNEDESKPCDSIINNISEMLSRNGYSVGINAPYSNSYTPAANRPYKSIMIEVNKKLYLSENNSLKSDYYKLNTLISKIYNFLLLTY